MNKKGTTGYQKYKTKAGQGKTTLEGGESGGRGEKETPF